MSDLGGSAARADMRMAARAFDQSRIYQAGHDMYVFEADSARPVAIVEPVLHENEAVPDVFVGRHDEVSDLLQVLDTRERGQPHVVVSGMPGVGKTALARRAARAAVGRGWFPGGAVLVDLHGYEPANRIESAHVFGPLLRSLGSAYDDVSSTPGEQAAQYHKILAQRARDHQPVLIVLDNASAASQIEPLLPTSRLHRVLVTSRHSLGYQLPSAHTIQLGALPEPEAVQLLQAVLDRQHPGDARVTEHHDQAEIVARLCGYLPLALSITAALLAEDTERPISELANDLAQAHTRLSVLDDGERAVRAAFDLSYRHLETELARLFRLLALNPGPYVATEVAAALADEPVVHVRHGLSALRRAHLIERTVAGAGRWRLHDLVRLYALELVASDPERDVATDRELRHYILTAGIADDRLRAPSGQPVPGRFTCHEQALDWLETERPNLVAVAALAAATERPEAAFLLTMRVGAFLERRRHAGDFITISLIAARAAHDLEDPHGEAMALSNLGLALATQRRFDDAITAHELAVRILELTGDGERVGQALASLGLTLSSARQSHRAIAVYRQALVIHRRTGDRHSEAGTLTNLGELLERVSGAEEGIPLHEHAVAIYHDLRDRHGEAGALNNLGNALSYVERVEEAIAAISKALAIFRETGDRHREGKAQTNLATAFGAVGRFAEAVSADTEATAIYRETGDRYREGMSLSFLALGLREERRFDDAIAAYQRSVAILRKIGDLRNEAAVLKQFGLTLTEVGRVNDGQSCWKAALQAFAEIGEYEEVTTLSEWLVQPPAPSITT
jgi:tetratricopeptide (TPR) repeat protein